MLRPPEVLPHSWASAWGEDEHGIWTELELRGVVQRLRWLAPGSFLMGSPADEPERYDDEAQHEVVLTRGFWLADTACTQALWQAVMGENPSRFKGADRPVETVSWEDCQRFLERINREVPGLDLRLPAEAEWEYACRAGTKTPFWFGETASTDQVNFDGNYPYAGGAKGHYRQETVPVKSLPANSWGLYEMHGNVWEWCADWFGPYTEGRVVDPQGPETGGDRVLRGGSWRYFARFCRSAYRFWFEPGSRREDFGFRLARGQESQAGTGTGTGNRQVSRAYEGGAERSPSRAARGQS
jgi:formylglycine-generating enzyme required for sulfatase activity